ncbi:hypothetical protein LTS14_002322, partial [Recurvomyces mirabilis]|uniref:uncharacterized protein n=1 Tax=Recurvomyces mirabilis TaxID=574656 RepID=UPI002DE1D2A4
HVTNLSHDSPHVAYGQFPDHEWYSVDDNGNRTITRGSFGGWFWKGDEVKLHLGQNERKIIPFAHFRSINRHYLHNIIRETSMSTAPKDIALSAKKERSATTAAAEDENVTLFAKSLRSRMISAQHETMRVCHESEIYAASAYSYEFYD